MTTSATPPDWDAIARYLSGESTAEEATVVRGWLESNPADREVVDRLGAVSIDAPADVDVEAALTRVHERMRAPQLTLQRGGAATSNNRGLRSAYFLAAGLAAAAVVAFIATRAGRVQPSETQAIAVAQTYSTGVGQRDSVLLADGSRIVLGPQTRLAVLAGYGTNARAVELTGDAYFDVKHDAAKPFSIRTAKALIEDIGTTFSVESDAANVTTVSVVSGSVRLRGDASAQTSGVVLAAGDRGTIDLRGNTTLEHQAVRDEDTAWISGRLAFRDAPLSRVAAEIQRWYGVKLIVADSLLGRHVTTSFEGNSVDQALNILGLTLGAKIERQGDSAIVSLNHGPATAR